MKLLRFLPTLTAWALTSTLGVCLAQSVHVSTGFVASPPAGILKISVTGDLVVRGTSSATIRYLLKTPVHDRSQVLTIRANSQKGSVELNLSDPPIPGQWSLLEVEVPRQLRLASIQTRGGNIEAYDMDGAIEASSAGGQIQMDRIGGMAFARTGGGPVRFGVMRAGVRVLSNGGSISANHVGGDSWFETSGGEIYLGESKGVVHASTGGGSIRIDKSSAAVDAQTAGGRIEVHQAGGIVTAENSSGSIQVGSAPGVLCESISGLIRLRGVSGVLRAITNAGNILVELLPDHPIKDSVLSTASGDITVLIPSNLPMTVRAQGASGRGRIVSDFAEIPVRVSPSATLAEGALFGGGPLLQISVAHGTIYLKRQK